MSVTNFRKASLKNGLPKSSEFGDIIPPISGIPIDQTGLTRYYTAQNTTSYPGSGTTWYDLVAGTYNATLTNGPTYTAPANSTTPGYILFDGTNDYATAADTGLPMGGTSRTIGGWFYPINSADGIQYIEYGTFGTSYGQIYFALVTGRTPNPGMAVNVYGPWYPSGLTGTLMNGALNTWTYNQFSYNSNGDWEINSNGSTVQSGNASGINTVSNGSITVAGGGAGAYANARFGEWFVYSRALSTAEMLANYNATKAQYGF
jgi:hypothetical protein